MSIGFPHSQVELDVSPRRERGVGDDENSSPPSAEVQTSTECEFDAFTDDSSLYYEHFLVETDGTIFFKYMLTCKLCKL